MEEIKGGNFYKRKYELKKEGKSLIEEKKKIIVGQSWINWRIWMIKSNSVIEKL